MAARTAYPPARIHSSEEVTPAQAQQMIARYLERTTSDASLHPDSTLVSACYDSDNEDSGVRFPQTGPQGGLTLHFLRRIEAGLRGEDLVAQSREELAALFHDEVPDGPALEGLDSAKKSRREQSVEKVAEWSEAVDADEYAQEQEVIDDEIGDDLAGTGEQGEEPPVKKTKVDKSARKAAKKDRTKERKRTKAQDGG